MHPLDHALSSQRIHGGEVGDTLALHSWFDASKAAQCHFTHRALRHHVEGIDEARTRFGDVMTLAGGAMVPVETLGRQHVDEDCRRVPRASDWLEVLRAPDWLPAMVPLAEEIAEAEAVRLGVDAEDILPVSRWMLETSLWFGDARHLAMRHHAFGIFEAEERFGIALPTASGRQVPVRYLAERHVRRVLGRIPTAADWLRRIEGALWMAEPRRPLRAAQGKPSVQALPDSAGTG